jgi:hypothetical protein
VILIRCEGDILLFAKVNKHHKRNTHPIETAPYALCTQVRATKVGAHSLMSTPTVFRSLTHPPNSRFDRFTQNGTRTNTCV